MKNNRPLTRLTIQSVPHPVPEDLRLRRLLKAMLRAYGFRLKRIETDPPPDQRDFILRLAERVYLSHEVLGRLAEKRRRAPTDPGAEVDLDLDLDELPLPPMTDGRTPEQLAADGDDRWPDGTPYIPPPPWMPPAGECPGHERGGTGPACCERAGEYNGYGSDGPLAFICPNHCSCHD